MVQDDEISNLQSDFSKMSWDDSVSPTTNTLGEIGQNTPDNDIQDIATGIKTIIVYIYYTYIHKYSPNPYII